MARIGLLGGSFDPIHVAHLMLAERVREARNLDRVLFIPAKAPPHKPRQVVAPAADRLQMVRLAIADNAAFETTDIELHRQGPSYSILTVRELQADLKPDDELFFLMGGDMAEDLPNWYEAEQLVKEIDFIAVDRPGHPLGDLDPVRKAFGAAVAERIRGLAVPFPQIDLSATLVRENLRCGRSVRYLVPESVRLYIYENRLYSAV